MKKIILLYLFLPFWSIAQLSQGWQNYSVSGRNYEVTTPSDYDANKEYPIVFELHSFGKNKNQMHDQNVVDQQQYISVRPEGRYVNLLFWKGNVWNAWSNTNLITRRSNDVSYITAVYNDVKQKMGNTFNAEKVYVYGFSNGGAMAMKMIEETNLFKAAIIRSMSFTKGHSIPSTASKIPMIFVHGTSDETVPYRGGEGKFGRFLPSPDFEYIVNTVQKWAAHNGLSNPLEVKYLKGMSSSSVHDFYFREYSHNTYPIYFFAIEGGVHATSNQFSNANIKRALLHLAKNPKQFGVYKLWN